MRAVFFMLILGALPALGYPQYHEISDRAAAQTEARQRNLPLAWMGGFPEQLNYEDPDRGAQADLTQMAIAFLPEHCVVIFFDGRNMGPVPANVHAQFHILDDGMLVGGGNWDAPKIVFTNPEVTKILGRVSHTQMHELREAAIQSVLNIIKANPTAMIIPPPPPPAPLEVAALAGGADGETAFGKFQINPTLASFIDNNRTALEWTAGALAVFLVLRMLFRRRS